MDGNAPFFIVVAHQQGVIRPEATPLFWFLHNSFLCVTIVPLEPVFSFLHQVPLYETSIIGLAAHGFQRGARGARCEKWDALSQHDRESRLYGVDCRTPLPDFQSFLTS
jgi:hypothetical protein